MPLDENDAMQLFNDAYAGFESVGEFFASATFESIFPSGGATVSQEGLSVNTEYFMLKAVAELGDERYQGRTLLYRDASSGKAKVLAKFKPKS